MRKKISQLILTLSICAIFAPAFVFGQTSGSGDATLSRLQQQLATAQTQQAAAQQRYSEAQQTYTSCKRWWPNCYKELDEVTLSKSALDAASLAVRSAQNSINNYNQRTGGQNDQMGNINQDQINNTNQALGQRVKGYCSTTSGSAIMNCIYEGVIWIISTLVYILLVIFASILTLSGYLLDLSIKYSVVDMSANIKNIEAIGQTWQILRDFANMVFIFFLLWVAIQTILQVGSPNAKKTLAQIVIWAILINFSMFFTKAVIDLSNIVTLAFYNQISLNGSVSEKFMQVLRIPTIFSSPLKAQETIMAWADNWAVFAGMSVGSIVILFTTAFSFLAVAWLMIFRYVVVVLLIVFSPIAFAAQALPQLKKVAGKWRDALVGQATFPIIYMALVYISLRIINSTTGQMTGSFSDAFRATSQTGVNPGVFGVIINFIVIIIFLNTALIVAKQRANTAGEDAGKILNWGMGKMDSLRKGTQGIMGRTAVRAVGIPKIDEKFKNSAFAHTLIGKEVRNMTTGAVVGVKFGSKTSVESSGKESKKLREDYAKTIEKDTEKQFDKQLFDQRRSAINTYNQILRTHRDEINNINNRRSALENRATDPNLTEAERQTALRDLEAGDRRKAELDNIVRNTETERDATQYRLNNKLVSTEKERQEKLRPMQSEKANELTKSQGGVLRWTGIPQIFGTLTGTTAARKEAAKVLRDRVRGKKAEKDQLLAELARQTTEPAEAAPSAPAPQAAPAAPTTP